MKQRYEKDGRRVVDPGSIDHRVNFDDVIESHESRTL